jgi:hypothetical protein
MSVKNSADVFGTETTACVSNTNQDVDDVVDEGGVGDGVVPVERLHRRVVDGLVRGDVDRGLARPHGAEREVGVHAAPVVGTHGADVPELGFACSNQQREGKLRVETRFNEDGMEPWLSDDFHQGGCRTESRTRVARVRGGEAASSGQHQDGEDSVSTRSRHLSRSSSTHSLKNLETERRRDAHENALKQMHNV